MAVSLELEELDSFRFWVLAQQDPKKFKWSSPDKAGTVKPQDVGGKIIRFAVQKFGAALPVKGDIWAMARMHGMKPVYRVEGEGGLVVFVDEDGNKVTPPRDMTFVESKTVKKEQGDKKIFVRESK